MSKMKLYGYIYISIRNKKEYLNTTRLIVILHLKRREDKFISVRKLTFL